MHPLYYILDENKQIRAATLEEWDESHSDPNRILARTKVGECEVITAFLGYDDREMCGETIAGPPLVFGTIEYWKRQEKFRNEEFSASYDEALKEHERRVAALKAATVT